jgi:hypothetical protein
MNQKTTQVLRNATRTDGRTADFEGPILSDLCQQPRLIINGVEIQIKLWPAKNEFILMTALTGEDYRIEMVEAYLRVCKITPIPAVMVAHADVIKDKPASYPFNATEMKAFQLNKGQYSFHLEDLFQSNVPTDVVVGMVTAKSFNGSFDTNPYRFQPFKLNSLGLYVDDESVPAKPLKMSFTKGQYASAYSTLFGTYEEVGNNISKEEYMDGYTFFVFRLIPDHLSPFIPTVVKGNVKLSGTFDDALLENITLLVYAKFPSILKIDSTRNVQI